MNVGYSKAFIKAVDKLSGKQLDSVRDAIREVKQAQGIEDITDCTRLVGYHTVYRIRIGGYQSVASQIFLKGIGKGNNYCAFLVIIRNNHYLCNILRKKTRKL